MEDKVIEEPKKSVSWKENQNRGKSESKAEQKNQRVNSFLTSGNQMQQKTEKPPVIET